MVGSVYFGSVTNQQCVCVHACVHVWEVSQGMCARVGGEPGHVCTHVGGEPGHVCMCVHVWEVKYLVNIT